MNPVPQRSADRLAQPASSSRRVALLAALVAALTAPAALAQAPLAPAASRPAAPAAWINATFLAPGIVTPDEAMRLGLSPGATVYRFIGSEES